MNSVRLFERKGVSGRFTFAFSIPRRKSNPFRFLSSGGSNPDLFHERRDTVFFFLFFFILPIQLLCWFLSPLSPLSIEESRPEPPFPNPCISSFFRQFLNFLWAYASVFFFFLSLSFLFFSPLYCTPQLIPVTLATPARLKLLLFSSPFLDTIRPRLQ